MILSDGYVSCHLLSTANHGEVYESVKQLATSWRKLGLLGLGIDYSEIEIINSNFDDDKLMGMLATWLRGGQTTKPSWKALCDGVMKIGRVKLAEEIGGKHLCSCEECVDKKLSKTQHLKELHELRKTEEMHHSDRKHLEQMIKHLEQNLVQQCDADAPTPPNSPSDAQSENQRMTELVNKQIVKEGKIELRILKCILLGGPGVGKTTTLLRLLGQIDNLSTSGYNPVSTGIDPAKVVCLRHQLYTDNNDFTVMIEKEWKALTLDEQVSVLLQCLESSFKEKTSLESCPLPSSPKKHTLTNLIEKILVTFSSVIVALPRFILSFATTKNTPADYSHSQKFSEEIEDLIKKSNWKKVYQKLLAITDNTTMMYITDAGGQPEFFDIIPLVVSGPSLCLIFINLALSLTSPFEVNYHHQQPSGRAINYNSSYTPLDMVQQILASLESLNLSTKQRSGAFIIGTYFDKVKEELVLEVEKNIEDAIKNTSFYTEDFLQQYTDDLENERLIYPLDNINGDKAQINKLRFELTKAIERLFKSEELPSSWGVFHLLLRFKYSGKGKLGHCSVQEAIKLAGCCGIHNDNDVKDVLKYFHNHFGTVFYFGDVEALKNIVICDPNLVFHPITKLVAESFGANPLKPNRAKRIRKTGEIKWNFFEEICNNMDNKTEFFNANMVCELLKSLNIITEIPSNGDIRLFMSCLLHPISLEELKTVDMIAKQDPSPLVFTFHPSGYQPVGLFHILLAQLLKNAHLTLHTPRRKNRVFLLYEHASCIEILSTPLNLEIHITNAMPKTCIKARKLIQDEIESIIKNTRHMQGTTVGIALYCPNGLESQSASPAHLAKYIANGSSCHSKDSEPVLHCSVCIPPFFPLDNDKYNIWFESPDYHDDSMTDGQQIDQKKKNNKDNVEIWHKKIDATMQYAGNKKGIIFIITMSDAKGTVVDAKNIDDTFSNCDFAVFSQKDLHVEELKSLAQAIGIYPFPRKLFYNYIAFFYTGHGGMDNGKILFKPLQVSTSSKKYVYLMDDIMCPMAKQKDKCLLFFLDCCLSEADGDNLDVFYGANNDYKNQHSDYLIAYGASFGCKAYGNKYGGYWTRAFCEHLKQMTGQTLSTVLDKTKEEINKIKKQHSCYYNQLDKPTKAILNYSVPLTSPVTTPQDTLYNLSTQSSNTQPIYTSDVTCLHPITIFTKHTPEILGVVSNTDSLAADLSSAGLLSDHTHFLPTNGSRYQKVKMLLSSVKECIIKSSKPEDILVKFCNVLMKQNNETLNRISTEIRCQLILSLSPDINDACLLLREIASKWDDISRVLMVPPSHREKVRMEGIMTSPVTKLEKTLVKWVESECSAVTWANLIGGLSTLQFNYVISNVKAFLMRDDVLDRYLPDIHIEKKVKEITATIDTTDNQVGVVSTDVNSPIATVSQPDDNISTLDKNALDDTSSVSIRQKPTYYSQNIDQKKMESDDTITKEAKDSRLLVQKPSLAQEHSYSSQTLLYSVVVMTAILVGVISWILYAYLWT